MASTQDYEYVIAIILGILILIYPALISIIVGLALIIFGALKLIK